jgi:endonuclease/exonuclease/phosphatase family metal-dependent hydrolase
MPRSFTAVAVVATLALVGAIPSWSAADSSASDDTPCTARAARVSDTPFHWFAPPAEDTASLESWCRAVGVPVIASTPAQPNGVVPALEDLVVISWNAHLADGRLADLIRDLRAGGMTDGRPVAHFVLLLQELYRRGEDVPVFAPNARAAFAILPRDPRAPDAHDYAQQLGLAMAYVPSMRNGAEMLEDRGNAIISTEPLRDLFALELPFERQRRVAAGAAITVRTATGDATLQLVDAHLEPLAAPSSLWILRNPRRRQMAALLDTLAHPRFNDGVVGTVLGGDFNTVQGGAREDIYRRARAWSRSLASEDPRSTHLLGRLDYVFARLSPQWHVSTTRVDEKYGSDHHPVLARFHRVEPTP